MKELVNKIYEKKSQYDILETQYKDICDQMESLDKDIKELSSKLLDEVKNTEEFKKDNGYNESFDNLNVEYFRRETTGYTDENAVLAYLKQNDSKFITVKESINKKLLNAELKKNTELKEALDKMLTKKVSEYVVVTTLEKAEKMHEHIENAKKQKLEESK